MMIDFAYKKMLKPILFRQDPESVHNRAIKIGSFLGSAAFGRALVRGLCKFSHPALRTAAAGITFPTPVGLAAGFDKNAELWNILPELGFGFAELGSVTGEPCAGNPKPRLFRVPKERSIIVNYGLYNHGCEAISRKLEGAHFKIPVGISVARTNRQMTIEEGITDYCRAYGALHHIGSYTTINISCPNTYDGQTFQKVENLRQLLDALEKEPHSKPIFLKIKPDLPAGELDALIGLCENYSWISGYIISNLTSDRTGLSIGKEELDSISPKGGLSGNFVRKRSLETMLRVRKLTKKIIIGCGGIFSGKDVYDTIKAGASLVQLVSALIYEGPGVIARINRELVDLVQKDGFGNMNEFIKNAHREV